MWMKICSERGRKAMYIGYVYIPHDNTSISVVMKGLKKRRLR